MKRFVYVLVIALFLAATAYTAMRTREVDISTKTALCAYRDGFAAVCGDTVRLISESGETSCRTGYVLHAVASRDAVLAAAGESGTVVVIEDGKLQSIEKPCRDKLTAICFFGERMLVGSETGRLWVRWSPGEWQALDIGLDGAVTGLSASDERVIAVTDSGKIAVVEGLLACSVMDYNEYYEPESAVGFAGIEYLNGMFWAYGQNHAGLCLLQ